MPVQHAIWKVGDTPQKLAVRRLPSEQLLEDMIVKAPEILSADWMLIGRQEVTTFGGRTDLLAIAPDASLVLIEIKRDRTPREIVAQALDYASWVKRLEADRIAQIYQRFSGGGNLDAAFRERFGTDLDEDSLNASHQIVLVAAELDDSTERIITYLNDYDIAINVIFFQVFEQAGELLLSRAWLIDPAETQVNVATTPRNAGDKEPWNGEYYVSFGHRDWETARTYGFVSGGGGSWYSRTLGLLSPGDRIWVKVPKRGYVGVGRVTESMQRSKDFVVTSEGGTRPVVEVLKNAEKVEQRADDPEMDEYFVRVQWLDTVPEELAFSETGLFGNQNTVCQPTATKWRHTVERLKQRFPRWND
jgi:hypothetical protein